MKSHCRWYGDSRMTRIALMPSSYLPSLGGVEELTRNLAVALSASGHQVEVWTPTADATSSPETETLDSIVVRRFPMPLPARSLRALANLPAGALRAGLHIRKALKDFAPDVIDVICFGPNGVYGTLAAVLTGVPLVVSLQGETQMDDHDIFDKSAFMRYSLRRSFGSASAVTACSRCTLDDAVARFGLTPGLGEVVYNGVDTSLVPQAAGAGRAIAALETALGSRPYVAAVGRVVEKKGFDLLARAFAEIADEFDDTDLVIGGEGRAIGELKDLVASLGLSGRVHLPGRLTREEVASLLTGSQVFVVPSRYEPFGIVVLEGWRAGVPVLATSRGGPAELISTGYDGVLADPFDTAAMAQSLRSLLRDPDRSRSIAEAGKRRVKDFDWALVEKHYAQIYDRVAKQKAP